MSGGFAPTFQIERGEDFIRDGAALWADHYRETEPEGRGFAPPLDLFIEGERAGRLIILTARQEGKIIAYLMFVLTKSPRHSQIVAFDDNFYVIPSARRGLFGYKFLKFCIAFVRRLGAVEWTLTEPEGKDYSRLFRRLGLRPAFRTWRGS